MIKNYDELFFTIQPFYYEGEEESSNEESNNEESNNNNKENKENNNEKKLVPQDQVNRLLAEERRKAEERARKANEKTIKELEELKKTHGLTEEERQRLEDRIENLRNEYLTKEQLEKKKRKEEEEQSKNREKELSSDRDRWKTLYEVSTIESALIDAAAKGDAYNPEQVLQILKPNTRLVEELDSEDKPTGRFVPKVRLAGKDKDGKPIILDLTPTEAVKQMKEMEGIYDNLFKSGARGGVGGNNNGSYSRNQGGPPLNDPKQYRQWRDNQKKAGAWT